MSNSRLLRFVAVAGVTFLASACSSTQKAHRADKGQEAPEEMIGFVERIAQFDHSQIALAHTALDRSETPEVRDLAEQLIDDHSAHLDALSTWVSGQTEPVELQAGEAVGGAGPDAGWHQAAKKIDDFNQQAEMEEFEPNDEVARLQQLSGEEFDKQFLDTVRKGQTEGKQLLSKGVDTWDEDESFSLLMANGEQVVEDHIETVTRMKNRL